MNSRTELDTEQGRRAAGLSFIREVRSFPVPDDSPLTPETARAVGVSGVGVGVGGGSQPSDAALAPRAPASKKKRRGSILEVLKRTFSGNSDSGRASSAVSSRRPISVGSATVATGASEEASQDGGASLPSASDREGAAAAAAVWVSAPSSHGSFDSRAAAADLSTEAVDDAAAAIPAPRTPPVGPGDFPEGAPLRPLGRLLLVRHTPDGDVIVERRARRRSVASQPTQQQQQQQPQQHLPSPHLYTPQASPSFGQTSYTPPPPPASSPATHLAPLEREEIDKTTGTVEERQLEQCDDSGPSSPAVEAAAPAAPAHMPLCSCRLCLRAHCERLTRLALGT